MLRNILAAIGLFIELWGVVCREGYAHYREHQALKVAAARNNDSQQEA